jgi:DNA repair protein RecO (recombination protein O)
MKATIVTKGIVLSRRDYQEADRILNVLTPDQGRLSLIAKGVRRPKSKLAGGIELFTVNELTVLPSKNQLQTLISSRMHTNYGNIVKDIQRTMFGYELLKQVHHYVEDEAGPEYFELLTAAFDGLNDETLPTSFIDFWFTVQMLKITGHAPNLTTDTEGNKLSADDVYLFDFESMAFRIHTGGAYNANHIKLLRLGYGSNSPSILKQVSDAGEYIDQTLQLAKNLLRQYVSG